MRRERVARRAHRAKELPTSSGCKSGRPHFTAAITPSTSTRTLNLAATSAGTCVVVSARASVLHPAAEPAICAADHAPPICLKFLVRSEERAIYERAVACAWGYYRELTVLLQGDAREILGDIWHISPMSHPRRVQKVDRQAEKRAVEVARYVLPVAAGTTMVHTLSGIVLHRLWRMAASDACRSAAVVGDGRACARSIRNFSTALTTRRWSRRKCRSGRTPGGNRGKRPAGSARQGEEFAWSLMDG
jgi:hypothetical protein